MVVPSSPALADLYRQDETAWLEAMAELARNEGRDELDLVNLEEYLTSMAQRDRREVRSRLLILLVHLLKWDYQPDKRSTSWEISIDAQRSELQQMLRSKTLRHHDEAILPETYQDAVDVTCTEMGKFPPELPIKLPVDPRRTADRP